MLIVILMCESTSRHFQQGFSRGLLCDCDFAKVREGSFPAVAAVVCGV